MSLRSTWQTLSDPTRLRILNLLRGEELSVVELQQVLHLGQSRISTHLSVLRSAGLASARREGKHTYYSLSKEVNGKTRQLLDAAWTTLPEIPEAARDREACNIVLEKRRADTRTYFNRIAGELGKAFCPGRTWAAVGPLLAQLVPSDAVIADLGAGEGWLSQLLAQNARQVIAVDNSPKMIAFAKAELKKKKIGNIDYRLGDLAAPPIQSASVDIVLMSQALHHAANPAQAVAAAAHLLKPKGRLLILDLNQHQFDQARKLYGDYWLGFSEADLRRWLKEARLSKINVQLLTPDAAPPHLQPILACGHKS
jgi:2-polyprenyl-3-methyl-5-hydroxy-6-metoxy-1,4-benzoquinol methylase